MKLNVVSFQMPYPANYGGVIDVYYKLKALSEAGVKVTLHTFIYGSRQPDERILDVCDSVYYYRRDTGLRSQLSMKPYIVRSRENNRMLSRLIADDAPVLLEGLHCCGLLAPLHSAGKKVAVRVHNVEHHYYRGLSQKAGNPLRKFFFALEAARLRRYEKTLSKADVLLTISEDDTSHYSELFPGKKVIYVPPFFDNATMPDAKAGDTGPRLLYHGNMTVGENIQAVNYLLESVIPLTATRPTLTVAGFNAPQSLEKRGATVFSNPTDAELDRLIASAAVNILITDQPTGMKLKLMKALGKARGYCLVNPAMITDRRLARYCVVADSQRELARTIDRMLANPRDAEESRRMRDSFLQEYGTNSGACKIIEALS